MDGNPRAGTRPITDPANAFVVIMKDGKIYQVTIRGSPGAPTALAGLQEGGS